MNIMMKIGVILLLIAAGLTAGCHLESGQRLLAELGLDAVSLAALPPPQRALACVAETDGNTLASFRQEHAAALAAFQRNPAVEDWSGLVCLALSSQAQAGQIKETIDVLEVALAARGDRRYDPLLGFHTLLKQRHDALAWHAEENRHWQARLAAQQAQVEQQQISYEEQLTEARRLAAEKEKQVETLEQQVRKLKEVELMLQPQSIEPR
ncbi:MAG: hypothetical protein KQH59_02195 [Desulfobulbaceae bacterium]|nr:hypothetical protein [Desulfobulbaceae bacterium]